MTLDVTTVIAWKHHASHPKETVDLFCSDCACSDCSTDPTVSPSVSLSLGLYSLRHANIEIRPVSLEYLGPIKPLSVQWKATDTHLSL